MEGLVPYKDPKDRAAANKRWYAKHRNEQIVRAKTNNNKLRDEYHNYKETLICTDCKIQYPYYVMDFDHVSDDKNDNVADVVRLKCSRKALYSEIKKCEPVCANCHRIRTHNRQVEERQKLAQEKNDAIRLNKDVG
jgi:hypothetical protein